MSAQNTFDLNLSPNDDLQHSEAFTTKRMKVQKNTKGDGILKFGLRDEYISEQGVSEEESSNDKCNRQPRTQGKSRLKNDVISVADQ